MATWTVPTAVLDERALLRAGISQILSSTSSIETIYSGAPTEFPPLKDDCDDIVLDTGTGPTGQRRYRRYSLKSTIVILGLQAGKLRPTLATLRALAARESRVLIVADQIDPILVRRVRRCNGSGLVSATEPVETLANSVHAIARGRTWNLDTRLEQPTGLHRSAIPELTKRKREVLALYTTGMTIREVAAETGLTHSTVKSYLRDIRAQFTRAGWRTASQIDLYRAAEELGMLDELPNPVR